MRHACVRKKLILIKLFEEFFNELCNRQKDRKITEDTIRCILFTQIYNFDNDLNNYVLEHLIVEMRNRF